MTNATRHAILAANYVKSRLEAHYPVLYARKNGRVAHEIVRACALEQHLDLSRLPDANLEQQPRGRAQERQRIAHNALVDRDFVRSTVERLARLVLEQFGYLYQQMGLIEAA